MRCWKYEAQGIGGFSVPVYLLDTDVPENSEWDRKLTSILYGGDSRYRLCQEVILGVGGVRMLRALGYEGIDRFHMNEGHASLLTLELMQEEVRKTGRSHISVSDLASVRQQCIFTTHTPVPAGHDQFALSALATTLGFRADLSDVFDPDMVVRVFGRHEPSEERKSFSGGEAMLNMTYLGLNMSRYVNGVAKRHGQVSRLMFAGAAAGHSGRIIAASHLGNGLVSSSDGACHYRAGELRAEPVARACLTRESRRNPPTTPRMNACVLLQGRNSEIRSET